jgi:hypothetical protein
MQIDKQYIPHVILGIRSDASRNDITMGFARASKRIRQSASSLITMEDLTTALSTLENSKPSPMDLHFLVPANPVVAPLAFQIDLGGRHFDQPQALLDETPHADEDVIDSDTKIALSQAYLHRGITHLHAWSWEDALNCAILSKNFALHESISDEALNLAAAAFIMLGDEDKAVAALTEAVGGDWSLALRRNLALLFIKTNPLRASTEIAHLVDHAPTQDGRLAAALLGVELWRKSHPEGTDDESTPNTIPTTLRTSLRSILFSDIDEEQFWNLGTILARTDANWVKTEALIGSTHAESVSANLLRLRSVNFENYIGNLCRVSGPQAQPWIRLEAEKLAREVVVGLSDEATRAQYAAFAVTLLKSGFDSSTLMRVNIRIILTMAMEELVDEDSEPITEIIGWLRDAKQAVNTATDDPREQQDLRDNVNTAFDILGRLFGAHRERGFQEVRQSAAAIEKQLSTPYGRRSADMQLIRGASQEISKWCNETLSILQQITAQMSPSDLRQAVQEFCENVTVVRDFVGSLR